MSQFLSKRDAKTFWNIFKDMEVCGCKRIDNSDTYQKLVAERIGEYEYSMAHYGEQNGDPMRDPEVVFYANPQLPEYVIPHYFRNDYIGSEHEYHRRNEKGELTHTNPKGIADLVSFCGTWFKNLRYQQGLK